MEEERNITNNSVEQSMNWQQSVMLYLHDLIHLIAIIIVVFLLLFRIVVVSGSSMYATFQDGDWLLVLSSVFYRNPEHGDVIIASKDSFNDGEPIIKRVIATEGQIVDIDFEAGIVYVDGSALEEEYIYTSTTTFEGIEFPIEVQDGCIFVMGDNRDRSKDSRSPEIGQIDKRQILGRAVFLVFPGEGEGIYGGSRNFDRIGVFR